MIKWSNKQNYTILFDSDIDGNGKGVLEHKVFNKKNLYFISIDNENNIFGGYFDTTISYVDYYIKYSNAYVFSLIRNGNVKNKKYDIKKGEELYAFCLWSNFDYLYDFGYNVKTSCDISISRIGYKSEYKCYSVSYECNKEYQPLRNNTKNFAINRVLVLEMNQIILEY